MHSHMYKGSTVAINRKLTGARVLTAGSSLFTFPHSSVSLTRVRANAERLRFPVP